MWRNTILFLETSEDRPSAALVTYMLRSMAATGALNEVCGILYGRPNGEEESFAAYDDALLRVLAELKLTEVRHDLTDLSDLASFVPLTY